MIRCLQGLGLSYLVLAAAGLASCAPTPNDVPCSNDAVCEQANSRFSYCLESRCVECLSSVACGDNGRCIDGACIRKCSDDRQCPEGDRCRSGTCASP